MPPIGFSIPEMMCDHLTIWKIPRRNSPFKVWNLIGSACAGTPISEGRTGRWSFHDFSGATWKNIRDTRRQTYLANAYRVLLTRARQGMVIYVPAGDEADHTRQTHFYDGIASFLRACGIPELSSLEGNLTDVSPRTIKAVLPGGFVA
jgi:hypothetical protein